MKTIVITECGFFSRKEIKINPKAIISLEEYDDGCIVTVQGPRTIDTPHTLEEIEKRIASAGDNKESKPEPEPPKP